MFWDSEGVILTHCFPKSTAVTGETYEDVLRTKFLPALRENGPKRLQLCSFITTTLLFIGRLVFTSFSTTTLKLFLMLRTHLTWLFPTLKDNLRGHTFSSLSALVTAIFQWSQRTPKDAFAAAMQSWRQRCEKFVRLQGDYVEK